jgi:hypothetical protein
MKLYFSALSILIACAVPCFAQTNCEFKQFKVKHGTKLKLQNTYTVTYIDKDLREPKLWKANEKDGTNHDPENYFFMHALGGFMYDFTKPVIIENKILGRQILNRLDDGNTVVITSREYTSRDYEGEIYIDSFVFNSEGRPLFEGSHVQGLTKIHTKIYEYDKEGRISTTKEINRDGDVKRSVVYTYTATGNGEVEVDATISFGVRQLKTKEVYNKKGDVVSTTNTHAAISGVGSGFAYYTYSYDVSGRWISREYHLGENGPVIERLERNFL